MRGLTLTLFLVGLVAGAQANAGGSCSTGVGQEDESLDGAHNARLGFQFMREAQKNPNLMADAIKDMQDPETMAEVQKMMQDPKMRQHMEMIKNNPEYARQLGEQYMSQMGPG